MINDSSHSGKAQHVDAAAHEANHQAFGIGFQKKMGAGRIYMGNHAEIHIYIYYISGWWLTYPSEKYEFVSWDDDIPIYYGKI